MINTTLINQNISLEDFTKNPPQKMEWVDGKLIEKKRHDIKAWKNSIEARSLLG